MTTTEFLPYLIPPILGGFIGYVTNYVAIRMLFRPLHPWRLFGIRLPLTPGVIPSQRHELARRMGEMVGSHLLTTGDVVQTLEGEAFRRELKIAVSDKLTGFLDRDIGLVKELIPTPFSSRFDELIERLSEKLAVACRDYLNSESFEIQFDQFVRAKLNELLAYDLESCLKPEQYDRLRHHLDNRLTALCNSSALAESVGAFVDERTDRLLRSDQPMRKLLPEDLVDALLSQLEKEVPPLLEKFGGMLYDPDFRLRLLEKIQSAIRNFLDSLGGLTGLLSGFLNMNKLDEKIPAMLDQASEEIALWLREEKTQAEVAALLRERITTFLDRPLADIVDRLSYEKVDGIRCFLKTQAIALIQSRRTVEALLGLCDRSIQATKDQSFGDLLDQILHEGGRERAIGEISTRLLSLLREPGSVAMLIAAINTPLLGLLERPIGKLSARFPADLCEELNEGVYRQVSELLRREVPPLLTALNVRQMVEDKVNKLDILQVEDLLLGVMKEQFAYINLFGALLGFLIGLGNLVLLSYL
jgi:uncharacterized membrane protein YheB (UPF0754 family)